MQYSADGRDTQSIDVGEHLVIRKAEEKLLLVHMPGYNFGQLLRAKLRWQGAELPWDQACRSGEIQAIFPIENEGILDPSAI